jgi:hypothetical protein
VLGVGDGLAALELGLALGSGLALGEEVGGGDDEVSLGDAVGVSVGDGLELSVGDAVEVSLGDGVAVSVGDGLEPSVGDAVGVSASSAAVRTAVFPAVFPAVFTAVSNAVFGSDEQVVLDAATCAVAASAASDDPNAVKPRMVNPATVPSAARPRITALTRATSLPSGSQAVGICRTSHLLTLFVSVRKAPASER